MVAPPWRRQRRYLLEANEDIEVEEQEEDSKQASQAVPYHI